nr:negative regulator of mitosis [Quercus suber]
MQRVTCRALSGRALNATRVYQKTRKRVWCSHYHLPHKGPDELQGAPVQRWMESYTDLLFTKHSTESLGVHTPVALPYLIREGILPHDPSRDTYDWETYVCHGSPEGVEEEVLFTKTAVAWSQGNFIRNIYRFHLEAEDVTNAVLTTFARSSSASTHHPNGTNTITSDYGSSRRASVRSVRQGHRTASHLVEDSSTTGTLERTLVVLLKTKVYVYFIHGAWHIVDIPFEIAAMFPAPHGVVLQRKPPTPMIPPSTPQLPKAPPNSFFSSQPQPGSSSSLSPMLFKDRGSTQPITLAPLGSINSQLEPLYRGIIRSSTEADEGDDPLLYTLSDPFSDLGVVSTTVRSPRARPSNKGSLGSKFELEAIAPGEEIVYVSRANELHDLSSMTHSPLMLIVTINDATEALTIWHAWYIEDRPLSSLMRQRAANKAAKLRRRSSFLSASIGTGATTPLVRPREQGRESFTAGARRLTREPSASQTTVVTSRQPSRKDEEEAMASQMDPDYPHIAAQQPLRENRRISSMNAELRGSQNIPGTNFTATGNRRHTSIGGHNERRSLSNRKSRVSTPGSAYSRSIGPEDDAMDIDHTFRDDTDEAIEEVLGKMRAAHDAAGTDNVFGSADEVFKRDLVVEKLHCFPTGSRRSSTGSFAPAARVVTLQQTESNTDGKDNARLAVYVHDRRTKNLMCLNLAVKQRSLFPDRSSPLRVAVPVVLAESKLGTCNDIIKLVDRDVESILVEGRGIILSAMDNEPLRLTSEGPYRAYDPLGIASPQRVVDKDIGRNRTLARPDEPLSLSRCGVRGSFDEVDNDGTHHRRRIQLRPNDPYIAELLRMCQFVLPVSRASTIRKLWCAAHSWLLQHPECLNDTACDAEWVALVTTVVAHALHLLDPRTRAALSISNLASGKQVPARTERPKERLCSNSAWKWIDSQEPASSPSLSTPSRTPKPQSDRRKDQLLVIAVTLADELLSSRILSISSEDTSYYPPLKLMLGLHVRCEEQKLSVLPSSQDLNHNLIPVIAQLGDWLGLQAWSFDTSTYFNHVGIDAERWSFIKRVSKPAGPIAFFDEPEGVYHWLELALKTRNFKRYPSLEDIALLSSDNTSMVASYSASSKDTPKLAALSEILVGTEGLLARPELTVELMSKHGIGTEVLQTLPDSFAAPFKEAIAQCERAPPTRWSEILHQLIGREDLDLERSTVTHSVSSTVTAVMASPRDLQTVCGALDHHVHLGRTKEAGRHAVSQLIFNEDRRLVDAFNIMHFNGIQTAECPKQPDWSDAEHFEQQRRVMQFVTVRMIALPVGDGMIHFDSQTPLLTEKYHLPGFNSSCLMQPMGHTLTTERTGLTEEKVNWAYFHAGVSTGLRIARRVRGIDTSWVAFNKPTDLTNRYAGLLLALGLSGHLRSLAKWLSFKYLTPKHNMTSVGLLLGLSASYMGTMDSLITRMLSVHITRMLPVGAAELNVSPVTQTAGLMGVGLLYYNTQHRRMSEIMVSEIEHLDVEDPDGGPDHLRDESYRLAAGFALGFINLGKGKSLSGLHGMQLPERLLTIAVGPRPVGAVHVFDRATAGAIIALVLMYMKTGDKAIAHKLDIPDTEAQYDHVRPDMLVLRAMARHLVLWDSIQVSERGDSREPTWITENLPLCYQSKFRDMASQSSRVTLTTSDVPFYNIATGLAWALSLRYAGSGNELARDEILAVLDAFHAVKSSEVYYYDAKLARTIIRRCIDVLALSAATVMAGTGDLQTFRYLRRLHGRTDAETPYGSHMAAHLAIGVLFLGGGTYTLGTSDLAIASLICAFYPLFPTDVHDNRVHLQAFRHLWVFAAEARCLVIEDIDTRRPVAMPICVTLRDGTIKYMQAPCLLQELSTIATIHTTDPAFWRVTLDFASNPSHLRVFQQSQRIYVRRCPAVEGHTSTFSSMLAALNDAQCTSAQTTSAQLWHAIFTLPAFAEFDQADMELVLPSDVHSAMHLDERRTVVDDRLVLGQSTRSTDRDALWNLRLLFAWAERVRDDHGDEQLRWIGNEVIDGLKAKIEKRTRMIGR